MPLAPFITTNNPALSRQQAKTLDLLISSYRNNYPNQVHKFSSNYRTYASLIKVGYLHRDDRRMIKVTIAGYYALAAFYLLNQLPTDSQDILNLMTYELADQE